MAVLVCTFEKVCSMINFWASWSVHFVLWQILSWNQSQCGATCHMTTHIQGTHDISIEKSTSFTKWLRSNHAWRASKVRLQLQFFSQVSYRLNFSWKNSWWRGCRKLPSWRAESGRLRCAIKSVQDLNYKILIFFYPGHITYGPLYRAA